jgi:hypothetical protein
MKFRIWLALVVITVASKPLFAHHSAAAEYVSQLSTWNAVITRFSWMNPHTFVFFDAKDANGNIVKYVCEGSAPSGLIGNGWLPTTLKPGDRVIIKGYRAKDRPDGCKVRSVTLPDGHEMIMGWDGGGAHAD